MYVNDLTYDERPEARMDEIGTEALTDAEVLAVILGIGKSKRAGIEQCRAIISAAGGLAQLARKHWREIDAGPSRARAVVAAFELSRRIERHKKDLFFKSPEDVAGYFGPMLRDLQHERFYMACLNSAKKVTHTTMISKGGKTATIVDPGEVLRIALLHEATSFVVVHNHPSGNRRASQADIAVTQKLKEAGDMLDVRVDDHVIITGYDYLSMSMEGLL